MGTLLDNIKKYLENTPKKIVEQELNKFDYLNEIGPDALEYVEEIESFYNSTRIEDNQISYNYKATSQFGHNDKFFLAA